VQTKPTMKVEPLLNGGRIRVTVETNAILQVARSAAWALAQLQRRRLILFAGRLYRKPGLRGERRRRCSDIIPQRAGSRDQRDQRSTLINAINADQRSDQRDQRDQRDQPKSTSPCPAASARYEEPSAVRARRAILFGKFRSMSHSLRQRGASSRRDGAEIGATEPVEESEALPHVGRRDTAASPKVAASGPDGWRSGEVGWSKTAAGRTRSAEQP
jgi:hypothetical protein